MERKEISERILRRNLFGDKGDIRELRNYNKEKYMNLQEIFQLFVEDFTIPSTLEETKIKNLLGHYQHWIDLDQYRLKHPEEIGEVLQKTAEQLIHMDLYKGCCSAFFCGFLMGESDPGAAGVFLIQFFAKAFENAQRVLDFTKGKYPNETQLDQLFEKDPDAVRAFRGMDPLMLAVMDALAKDAKSREELRKLETYDDLEKYASFIKNGGYLLRIYSVCSPLEIVVLSPRQKQGLVVQVKDIGTNFHFMTLLERALCQNNKAKEFGLSADVSHEKNKKIFAYSAGEEDARQNQSVTAHAFYTSFDGTMLWGEMPPDSIPEFLGKPVVLIYPEQFHRSWDLFFAVRCHPFLCPDVTIQSVMTEEEVEDWLSQLPKPLEPVLPE